MISGGQKASHFAIYVINFGEIEMKLTESKIKQIILEEIQDIVQNDPEQEEKEDVTKLQSDVAMIKKMMPKIDTHIEYQQLLNMVLNHDFGDDQKKRFVLIKAQKDILKMIQGM